MHFRFLAHAASLLAAFLLAAPSVPAAPGDLDTFNPAIFFGGDVYAAVTQTDGKILLVGNGWTNGTAQYGLGYTRLNANGSRDTYKSIFTAGGGVFVYALVELSNSKCLIPFSQGAGQYPRFFQADATGAADPTFLPSQSGTNGANDFVGCLAAQADGKILVGGNFTTMNGVPSVRLARLNADGSLDPTFSASVGASVYDINGAINCIALQADGRILLGGGFNTVNGVTRNGLARLEANGALDPSFNPAANQIVRCLVVQPDGRILVGGRFTAISGVSRNRLARVDATGAVEAGFNPNVTNATTNVSVGSIALQADGRMIIAGEFNAVGGTTRNRLARLNADGTLATGFDPNANDEVYGVTLQGDGMVLVGGKFASLQPNGAATATTRFAVARLVNGTATQTVSVPDTAHATWTRGGTTPEVRGVTFELSTDGGATWGSPVAAARVGTTANWQASGLALPASGQLRVRGVTSGGFNNASAGYVEQVASFSGVTQTAPEINLSSNGVALASGGANALEPGAVGVANTPRTYTIVNTGTGALNLTGSPRVVVSGPQAADFVVTAQPASPVAASGGSTTFQVTFRAGAEGVRQAVLSLASNDADESPFTVALTGRGLSFGTDSDGDGMSDAAEFQLRALGFDWTDGSAAQQQLVATYYAGANGAGLYTAAQVQALNVDAPLLQRNPTNGQFTLILRLQKSTDLQNFTAFPFSAGSVSVDGSGQLQFSFSTGDNAAFFRVQTQ